MKNENIELLKAKKELVTIHNKDKKDLMNFKEKLEILKETRKRDTMTLLWKMKNDFLERQHEMTLIRFEKAYKYKHNL